VKVRVAEFGKPEAPNAAGSLCLALEPPPLEPLLDAYLGESMCEFAFEHMWADGSELVLEVEETNDPRDPWSLRRERSLENVPKKQRRCAFLVEFLFPLPWLICELTQLSLLARLSRRLSE